jgi:hypothetical protein
MIPFVLFYSTLLWTMIMDDSWWIVPKYNTWYCSFNGFKMDLIQILTFTLYYWLTYAHHFVVFLFNSFKRTKKPHIILFYRTWNFFVQHRQHRPSSKEMLMPPLVLLLQELFFSWCCYQSYPYQVFKLGYIHYLHHIWAVLLILWGYPRPIINRKCQWIIVRGYRLLGVSTWNVVHWLAQV